MKFKKGVAEFKEGNYVKVRIVDNAAFSRIWPKYHTKTGYTVEFRSGPKVLPTLEAAIDWIQANKGNEAYL